MQKTVQILLIFLLIVVGTTTTLDPEDTGPQTQSQGQFNANGNSDDYSYDEPYVTPDDLSQLHAAQQYEYQRPKKYFFSHIPRSAFVPVRQTNANVAETASVAEAATECAPEDEPVPQKATTAAPEPGGETSSGGAAGGTTGGGEGGTEAGSTEANELNTPQQKQLHQLVQHLYIAQARVQLEATEIKKAQSIANAAQEQLEEAASRVRAITAALQASQQEVAAAAIRAQTAQLQLAAHDQLLFAARQDVDALSSQMVGLKAAEGFQTPKISFDVNSLMNKLKQPLADNEKPTAIPPVCPLPNLKEGEQGKESGEQGKESGKTGKEKEKDKEKEKTYRSAEAPAEAGDYYYD